MNKYYLMALSFFFYCVSLNGGSSNVIEIAEDGWVQNISYEMPATFRNPFTTSNLAFICAEDLDQLARHIYSKINGYLEAADPVNSCCLYSCDKIVNIGETIALATVLGGRNEVFNISLHSVQSPFIIFSYLDKEIKINMSHKAQEEVR